MALSRAWAGLPIAVALFACGVGHEPGGEVGADTPPAVAGGASDGSTISNGTDGGWPSGGGPAFTDATSSSGLDFVHRNGMRGERWFVEMMGSGVALFDYDDDGDLDLFLVQGGSLDPSAREDEPGDRLYRNELISAASGNTTGAGAGGASGSLARFVDVTTTSGIAEAGYGMGTATGDYDGDGLFDLYVTNWGRDELWRNRGDGTFERRGAAAGVDDPSWSVPAVFFDADRDGKLDLFVGNYVDFSAATHKRCLSALGVLDYCGPLTFQAQPDVLYRNRGDGTFEDVSGPAGLRQAPPMPALGALAIDADDDGWLDLFVANDQTANYFWHRRSDGRFAEAALLVGCALDADGKPQANMGVTAGDYDADGDEDLFVTHLTGEHHTLYVDRGGGAFEDTSATAGLVAPTWSHTGFGVGWIDVDGDGWLDLLATSGMVKIAPDQVTAGDPLPLRQPGLLLHNQNGRRFAEVKPAADDPLARPVVGRGAALGDVDNDGDTDAVVTENNGPARLLLNQIGNRRPWLGLRLVERAPSGRDRDVLDTWVGVRRASGPVLWRRVRTAGSYASANDPRLQVGLGDGGVAVGVDVKWPDGTKESWGALEAGRYHTLRRGEGRGAH